MTKDDIHMLRQLLREFIEPVELRVWREAYCAAIPLREGPDSTSLYADLALDYYLAKRKEMEAK